MADPHFRSLLLIVRVFALIVAFSGIFSLVLWIYYPDSITSLDNYIVRRYTSYYQDYIKEARALASSGQRDRAMEVYARMLDGMEDIRKQDSLWPTKRTGLMALVNLYLDAHSFPEAAYWLQKWLSVDDRDLAAQYKYAKLLPSLRGDPEAGVDRIEAIYHKFPNYDDVFTDWFFVNAADGDSRSICALLKGQYERLLIAAHGKWKVSWISSEGEIEKWIDPAMTPDGEIIVAAVLPQWPRGGLRLQAPPWPHYLTDAEVELSSGEIKTRSPFGPPSVQHSQRIRILSEGVYETTGKDSFWVLSLRDFSELRGRTRVVVRGKWLPVLSTRIIAYLKKRHLMDSGNNIHDAICAAYQKIVKLPPGTPSSAISPGLAHEAWILPKGNYAEIIGRPVELFWTNSKGRDFTERLKRRLPLALKGNRFEGIEFDVHDRVCRLRFDPLTAVFATYKDLQIEVVTDHGARTLDLKDLDIQLHEMKRLGPRSFQSLGRDPFLFFTLSKEPVYVAKVRINAAVDEKFLVAR